MKKVILFSKLTENNTNELLENIFPIEIKNKVVAYMPSDGWNIKEKYTQEWINYTKIEGKNFSFEVSMGDSAIRHNCYLKDDDTIGMKIEGSPMGTSDGILIRKK